MSDWDFFWQSLRVGLKWELFLLVIFVVVAVAMYLLTRLRGKVDGR